MKKKRFNFGYYLQEGFGSIFTHGFMSFASISIIIACLLIMGSFSLIAENINALIAQVENKNEVLAYVDETLTEEAARNLEDEILALSNIQEVRFVSREEAMNEFVSEHEDGRFDEIDPSAFRHRYVIQLEDITLMEEVQTALMSVQGIAKVNAHLEVAQGFITVRNIVSIVSITLTIVLFCVSVFIIANTIKLATFDRRDEIAIMKMVGATNNFIRWPFVFQGFILGLTGAAIAFLLQWGLYQLLADKIMTSAVGSLVFVIPFSEMANYLIALFVGTGFLVGILGSVITIRNYLKV